jgi:predicted deacetylase
MRHSPAEAQYLLRFDDLCPTMDQARWARFAALVARFKVQPILAVVPDNRDPELERDSPDEGFWEQMRALEDSGAAIGLHGYRHVCAAHGRSLILLHERTEFTGVAPELQREWIKSGLTILRSKGLGPRLWVAPRHGFDYATLRVLRAEGIGLVSDGFAKRPFLDEGLVWIPQQLWCPVEKSSGLWTICIHTNSATDESVGALESFLERHGSQFTSVDRVLAEWPLAKRSVADRWFHTRIVLRLRIARFRRRWRVSQRTPA